MLWWPGTRSSTSAPLTSKREVPCPISTFSARRSPVPDMTVSAAPRELRERLLKVGQASVGGVVVELDVGHDGDVAAQLEERAVGLVGLDHGPLPRAPGGVRAGRAQLAADQERRLATGLEQTERDHRGCGGLPVGAAHGDRPLHPRELTEQIAAVEDARARRPGGRQLRVVVGDGRGDHHLRALGQVRRRRARSRARCRRRAAARHRTTRPGRSR